MEDQWLTKLMNKISRSLSSLKGFLRNFNWNRIFQGAITFNKATEYVCSQIFP